MSKANHPLAETRAIETRNEFGLSNTESINVFEVLKFNANISIIKKYPLTVIYLVYL